MACTLTVTRIVTAENTVTYNLDRMRYIVRGRISNSILAACAYPDDALGLARAMYPQGFGVGSVEVIDTVTGLAVAL